MADPKVRVKFEVDASSYSAAVNKAKGQIIDFGQASRNVHKTMVTDVQATSGALRLIDGGIQNNIRSAERWLSSIKGIGPALQLIYPGVGMIATVALIARGVGELTAFVNKTKEAGAEFRRSFQEIENSSRLSNDELAKTNVELENQIAKLTGKHENVLKAELIDARIEADHLAMSAAGAAKQIKDLLEKSQAGVLAQLMGSGPTKEVFGNIENFQNVKAQAQQDRADALHRGDQASADAAQKRYEQALQNERAYLLQQRNLRSGYVRYEQTPNGPALVQANKGDYGAGTYGSVMGDQSRNLDAINAALNLNYDQSDRIALDSQHQTDSGTLKRLQDAKNAADKAKQAAAKQLEDYKQELSEFVASLAAGPGETEAQFHTRVLSEEADFWAKRLSTQKQGTEAYKLIQQQLADVVRQANQQFAQAQNEAISLQKERDKFISETFGDNLDLSRGNIGDANQGKDVTAMLAGMNESVSIANQNADTWREAQIQIGLASGQISKYDAAVATMQLHRDQYNRASASIAASRASLLQRYGSADASPEARAAFGALDNQQVQLDGQYQVQNAQDHQAVTDQTGSGSLRGVMNQYIIQSRDTASQVRSIWSSSLSGINEELSNMLSGQRTSWSSFLGGIARDFANIFLQRGESAIIGSLFGEPGGKSGGALSGMLSGIGSFFTGLGFADGGIPPVGLASLVGERGPELFVPHTSGTVIPNHLLGGNTVQHTWNVDARGASDPASVEAAVNRAIVKAAPSLTAMSMHAQREANARKPASRRN